MEIYTKPGCCGRFDEARGLLTIDLSKCPSNDEFDHMWTVMSTFIAHYESPLVLLLRHADGEFDPPGQHGMMHIASKMMTEFSKIDKKCKKVIVQPRVVDGKVELASMVMQKMCRHVPLRISDDPSVVNRLLDKYCAKAQG